MCCFPSLAFPTEAEEGGVNHFVFVDQGAAGQALGVEPKVGAVADRGERRGLGRLDGRRETLSPGSGPASG